MQRFRLSDRCRSSFDGMQFNQGLCVDLVVEGRVVAEWKSTESLRLCTSSRC
jgi:hypothetical protein